MHAIKQNSVITELYQRCVGKYIDAWCYFHHIARSSVFYQHTHKNSSHTHHKLLIPCSYTYIPSINMQLLTVLTDSPPNVTATWLLSASAGRVKGVSEVEVVVDTRSG